VRDICEEVGAEVKLVDLVGLYQLTSSGDDLPDVLVHVFRAKIDGEVTVNAPGRISRLCWHGVDDCPSPMTAVTRAAVADASVGKAGLLRTVHRDAAIDFPDAVGDDDVVVDTVYAGLTAS
jgi:hypothetical protein